ncbi:sigma-70 family RNA polymerase sigma factor [Streptomyces sp. YC537]|uniref:Sigma-70 family RNA polymerase sigma factor n=1 Tax=Streptomyces boluensis TaxID=1775135 RepID=A0A964V0V7_9ACTN|nr:sigma-70 family RNA polymerase sigma factor [Streptomyces boluensis]
MRAPSGHAKRRLTARIERLRPDRRGDGPAPQRRNPKEAAAKEPEATRRNPYESRGDIEVWRKAARFRPDRGSAMTWVLTLAHHRAVDRVRAARAGVEREHRAALLDRMPAYDEVTEQVEARLEQQRVRRCLGALTQLQREAVTLAYYRGLTYREVAQLLTLPLGTVKTRLRDGLIRLRDCLGVSV